MARHIVRYCARSFAGFVDSLAFRILLSLVAVGLLWVQVHPAIVASWLGLDPDWAHAIREVAVAFAIALLTALLLMLLVDRPIKKALERDVFRSVMGYLLSDAIREELRWVYSMNIVCIRSLVVCTIRRLDGHSDLVSLDLRIERTFRNFNTKPERLHPSFDLEEWCHAERTRITQVGARRDSTVRAGASPRLDPKEPRLRAALDAPLVLSPNGEAEVWYEGREIKHVHDHYMMVFLRPTLDPQFVVDVPDGFGRTVHFRDGREPPDDEVQPEPGRRWVLRGTMLPFQATEVRWWVATDMTAVRAQM